MADRRSLVHFKQASPLWSYFSTRKVSGRVLLFISRGAYYCPVLQISVVYQQAALMDRGLPNQRMGHSVPSPLSANFYLLHLHGFKSFPLRRVPAAA